MTRHPTPATATFIGAAGNKLVADVFGDSGSPVLSLHGGGQTRHAWYKTAEEIARKGHTAFALDQHGHGDSEWIANGAYEFSDYAADAKVVAAELTRRSGTKPIVIGASLGGIASLLAEGNSERDKGANVFSALVLVDITPRVVRPALQKFTASCAQMPGKGLRRLPTPRRQSPIIFRNGRGRRAMRD